MDEASEPGPEDQAIYNLLALDAKADAETNPEEYSDAAFRAHIIRRRNGLP